MTTPDLYVVDTHALYWNLSGTGSLSAAAKQVFVEAQTGRANLIVSHVVLAELFYLLEKYRRPELFEVFVVRLQASPAYRIAPLLLDDVLRLKDFAEIPEMHDRLIAIQAHRLGAKILTKDPEIQASPQVECVW